MEKTSLLYEGKAKKVYSTLDPDLVVVEYKDSLTAFNAQKKGSFENKGRINLEITCLLFQELSKKQIQTHFVKRLSATELLVKKLEIVPLEVVVRNRLAGSTAKKLGFQEGHQIKSPLVEFYYKNDALEDPFVSDDQILMMGIATEAEIETIKAMALRINQVLKDTFAKIQIDLVDFKVELGRLKGGELILADEISPDCARLWDQKTQEKLDKDRFRRDLGKVEESYHEVLKRLEGINEK